MSTLLREGNWGGIAPSREARGGLEQRPLPYHRVLHVVAALYLTIAALYPYHRVLHVVAALLVLAGTNMPAVDAQKLCRHAVNNVR